MANSVFKFNIHILNGSPRAGYQCLTYQWVILIVAGLRDEDNIFAAPLLHGTGGDVKFIWRRWHVVVGHREAVLCGRRHDGTCREKPGKDERNMTEGVWQLKKTRAALQRGNTSFRKRAEGMEKDRRMSSCRKCSNLTCNGPRTDATRGTVSGQRLELISHPYRSC